MNEIKCLDKGFVRLVSHMGDDSSVVQMARVSYGNGTKQISEDRTLIRYLLRNRHSSPFEGVIFKFHVKAPIFVFRQWHRHRTWSYNEISGRYSVLKDEYYVPEENVVTTQNPTNKQGGTNEVLTPFNLKNPDEWWDCIEAKDVVSTWNWGKYFEDEQQLARYNYERYINSGMRRELARINLPLAQYSEMYAVVDLHNLFHFLKLRQDEHAQYEIRCYADALLELIKPIVPLCVDAYEDYIKNSINLSVTEQRCLSSFLSKMDDLYIHQLYNEINVIENKREREELKAKIDQLLSNKNNKKE